MGRVVVSENMSADGVVAPLDGWFEPSEQDDELRALIDELDARADAVVLGRRTFEEFAGYWPHQDVEHDGIAAFLNGVEKFVVSATPPSVDWPTTHLLDGDPVAAVQRLARERSGEVMVPGSVTLAQALLLAGAVDVIRLFVYPTLRGEGRRLLQAGAPVELRLTGSRALASGVVHLEYARR